MDDLRELLAQTEHEIFTLEGLISECAIRNMHQGRPRSRHFEMITTAQKVLAAYHRQRIVILQLLNAA